MLGVRVIGEDGYPISGNRYLFVRYLPVLVASFLGVLVALVCLADVIMIFRESRKCLHDDLAGRVVIKVD